MSSKEPSQCRRQKRHGFDPWVGKIPGEGNGNPLQYSCLECPMDRAAWWAIVRGVSKSRTRLNQLSMQASSFIHTQIFTTHYPLFCFLKMQISLWHHFHFLQFDNFLQYFCRACVLTMNSVCFFYLKMSLFPLQLWDLFCVQDPPLMVFSAFRI